MLLGNVLGFMGRRVHQMQLHLKRRVSKQTGELSLRVYFSGHKVQKQYSEGSDILHICTGLRHNEYIFVFQDLDGR